MGLKSRLWELKSRVFWEIFLKFSSFSCVQNKYSNRNSNSNHSKNSSNCISANGVVIDGTDEKGVIRYLHEELWLKLAINDSAMLENENVIESYCLKHTIGKDISSWFWSYIYMSYSL